MNPAEEFEARNRQMIADASSDQEVKALTANWFQAANRYEYSYHFSWLSRPIIQYPQDMVALQEVIWRVRPDLIIETGIAHGGSLILSASMLALLDYCDAATAKASLSPQSGKRRVLGIDIDIRAHNRAAIEAHPLAHMIDMLQGSSIDPELVAKVHAAAAGYERVMVILDSNHTHAHVLAELEAYAPLTTPGSYCVVFDTVVEDLPESMIHNRPWSKGNNPKTAVFEFLRRLDAEGRKAADGGDLRLTVDEPLEQKLLITVAPSGYLKRI